MVGQGGFYGNSIPESGMYRVGRKERVHLMLGTKRTVKWLDCNVGGGSGMT